MIKSKILWIVFLVQIAFFGERAFARWSANLGYHNPPIALVGINSMKEWSHFAFEAGVGWIDASLVDSDKSEDDDEDEKSKDSATLGLAGGINGKYLFDGGRLRPYLQAGVGSAIGASVGKYTGIGAQFGGGYGGGGVYLGGKDLYGYLSANYMPHFFFAQAGIGMGF